MRSKLAIIAAAVVLLSACEQKGQNQYDAAEVGKAQRAEFGTVIATREVTIKGENTNIGSYAGAAAGGVGGYQFGNGNGQVATTIAGAVVGAIAGHVLEEAIAERKGIEYTITKESGDTVTIVQDYIKDERLFNKGERVLVQTSSKEGGFQRVLPADHLPGAIDRPQGVDIIEREGDVKPKTKSKRKPRQSNKEVYDENS